eukprot:6201214-Pleurochrysis_carterae.AAC.1
MMPNGTSCEVASIDEYIVQMARGALWQVVRSRISTKYRPEVPRMRPKPLKDRDTQKSRPQRATRLVVILY